MLDKKYLDKLKEEDYIAWDDLVNDPMVVVQDTSINPISLIIVLIIVIGLIIKFL